MMKDDDFKLLRGFQGKETDGRTNCKCKVAFATEKYFQPCVNRARNNQIDVCCRDPNYKDPWPDTNNNGNGGQQGGRGQGQQGGQGQGQQGVLWV